MILVTLRHLESFQLDRIILAAFQYHVEGWGSTISDYALWVTTLSCVQINQIVSCPTGLSVHYLSNDYYRLMADALWTTKTGHYKSFRGNKIEANVPRYITLISLTFQLHTPPYFKSGRMEAGDWRTDAVRSFTHPTKFTATTSTPKSKNGASIFSSTGRSP